MAAHEAPPSLGFSRQEHCSGLPFSSLMHESEKWEWSRLVVSNLATPWTAAYQALLPMGFSRQEYWSGVPLLSPRETEKRQKEIKKRQITPIYYVAVSTSKDIYTGSFSWAAIRSVVLCTHPLESYIFLLRPKPGSVTYSPYGLNDTLLS